MAQNDIHGPFRDGDLMLRRLMGRDAGELYLLIDGFRRELSPWLPWVNATKAVADSSYYIMSLSGFWNNGLGYGIFAGSELAGAIGFQAGDERNNTVEVGYWLAPPWHRRGLAFRALTLALDAGFAHTTVHRVEARVQGENVASIRLLEKRGFSFEGVEREGLKFPDGPKDHRVYSLLRHEFAS